MALLLFAILWPLVSAAPVARLPACPALLPTDATPRIIGGSDASPHTRSYMVSFLDEGCGGSLLSDTWVLTAAHCLISDSSTARIGGINAADGLEIPVKQVIEHPKYQFPKDDITLVELALPAPASANFISVNSNPNIPEDAEFARIAGFGFQDESFQYNHDTKLRQVDVPIMNTNQCIDRYHSVNSYLGNDIVSEKHLCAGYDDGGCDACTADSGGPLFVYDDKKGPVQIAIVSFGYGCAREVPGGYTRISTYVPWMKSVGAILTESSSRKAVFQEDIASASDSDTQDVEALQNGDDEPEEQEDEAGEGEVNQATEVEDGEGLVDVQGEEEPEIDDVEEQQETEVSNDEEEEELQIDEEQDDDLEKEEVLSAPGKPDGEEEGVADSEEEGLIDGDEKEQSTENSAEPLPKIPSIPAPENSTGQDASATSVPFPTTHEFPNLIGESAEPNTSSWPSPTPGLLPHHDVSAAPTDTPLTPSSPHNEHVNSEGTSSNGIEAESADEGGHYGNEASTTEGMNNPTGAQQTNGPSDIKEDMTGNENNDTASTDNISIDTPENIGPDSREEDRNTQDAQTEVSDISQKPDAVGNDEEPLIVNNGKGPPPEPHETETENVLNDFEGPTSIPEQSQKAGMSSLDSRLEEDEALEPSSSPEVIESPDDVSSAGSPDVFLEDGGVNAVQILMMILGGLVVLFAIGFLTYCIRQKVIKERFRNGGQ